MADPSPLLFALLFAIQIVGTAAKPSPYRWSFFIPSAALAIYLFLNSDNIETAATLLLTASDFFLITDVQRELRLIGGPKSISDAPLRERLKWAVQLVLSHRGVGWAHEPTAVLPPRPKHYTRLGFIASRVSWMILYMTLFDAGQALARHNPSFLPTAPPFAEQTLLWRSYTMAIFLVTSVSFLVVFCNLVPSIIFVAAGWSQPDEWPHLFGTFALAYNVRNFWSRTWHQMLRRKFTSHGKYLAHKVLSLTPGSKASRYTQIAVAFFLSGLVHTRGRTDGGGLYFFGVQAIAILLEDTVLSLAKKLGLEPRLRSLWFLGYVWVWCWFLYTFPPFYDSMLHTEMFASGRDLRFLFDPAKGDWLFANNGSLPFVGLY